jgi:hypothetical protein
MLTIPGHKRNANQNHTKIPPYFQQQQMLARMWGKRNLIHCWWESGIVFHFAKQYGDFLKNRTKICHMIQQYHS